MLELWIVLLLALDFVHPYEEHSLVDCYPEPGANESSCKARGCIWQQASSSAPEGIPWCFYPTVSGFRVMSQVSPTNFLLTSAFDNPYGSNISPLNVSQRVSGDTLFVTIGNDDRYVPPVDFPNLSALSTETLTFKTTVIPGSDIFAFQVIRKSTNTILWDTTIGGMQFADKFIQIATYLPSRNIFGLGEHIHQRLKNTLHTITKLCNSLLHGQNRKLLPSEHDVSSQLNKIRDFVTFVHNLANKGRMHDLSRYTVWPMFARDIGPDSSSPLSTQNLYGVHPFYICVENDGKAHGVFILNSNAQEVVTGPGPHLIYRTIGGRLDLAFFPGPTAHDVVRQYLAYVGRPHLPAYWALGYQLSRWGYPNLDAMKTVVARTQAAQVPLDVAYADIDYMDRFKDFTEGADWAGFGAYVDDLHNMGLHLILIFDPAIEADYASFQRAREQNVSFIEWADKSQVPTSLQNRYPLAADTLIMLGNVWPDNNTAMPDFLDPTNKTLQWWISEYQLYHKKVGFDGIWIDMNEPSNFDTDTYSGQPTSNNGRLACPITGPGSEFDNPPYQTYAVYNRPGEHLCSKTLCMLAKTGRRTMDFYNTKNLYGMSEAKATIQALSATTGKRGAVISRSTFPSSGRYGGVWLGDNTATWKDLQTSVIGVMEFNFFGIPYVGSDICGFNGNTTEELCLRWHQMAAFHPFCRNHNTQNGNPQDPAVWPSVAKAARIALGFRYKYLPYLYSLFYSAAVYGETVIRPLFFEYPSDFVAMDIDHQFLWGSAIMVAPALEENITSVHTYFPSDVWYSLVPESYGQQMDVGYVNVEARLDSLTPVFARGGSIIPRQGAGLTTTQSRLNPLELLVTTYENASSWGELYWDAGDDLYDSIDTHKRHHWTFDYCFSSSTPSLQGKCHGCDMSVKIPTLDVIEILGYDFYPIFSSFTLNGVKVNIDTQASSYMPLSRRLFISTKNLINLSKADTFELSWSHQPVGDDSS